MLALFLAMRSRFCMRLAVLPQVDSVERVAQRLTVGHKSSFPLDSYDPGSCTTKLRPPHKSVRTSRGEKGTPAWAPAFRSQKGR